MKCFSVVGQMTNSKVIYKTVDGERFYKESFTMGDVTVCAVISEYLQDESQGINEVECYIRTETTENDKLFTFLSVMSKKASNAESINRAVVGGIVSKVNGMKVKEKVGQHVLPFILKYKSHDDNFNVAHIVAKGLNARKLSKIEIGDILEVSGPIKIVYGAMEVVVETVDLYRKKAGAEERVKEVIEC